MKRFFELLDELQHRLLELATVVESNIHRGTTAMFSRDTADCKNVISRQRKIDELAVENDEFVTDLLARHQPVAVDLAFLTAALKIGSDLKRMGELSVNIAQRSVSLSERTAIRYPDGLVEMAHRVQVMVSKSFQAFAQRQGKLAAEVIASDEDVNQLRTAIYADLVKQMEEQPQALAQEVDLMFIVHNLERIGDHAKNVAEDVLLFVGGGKNRTSWTDRPPALTESLDAAPAAPRATISERPSFK